MNSILSRPLRTFFKIWSRQSLPQVNGVIFAEGLQNEASVERDKWGIPTIRCSNRRDLFFTQGFVHAQDRMWQMDINRRAASGRLSEVLGSDAVETDRLTRTLGFRRRAKSLWENSSSRVKADFEAYAAGVNAFLANQPKLPLEFSLLGYRPEPWDVLDSTAFGGLLAWTLSSGWAAELVRARLIDSVGGELAANLEPGYPGQNPVTLPGGIEYNQLDLDPMIQSAAGPYLKRGLEGSGRGSNAWVIAGSRTSTGYPILCNDMHLPVPTPSLWYFNRLVFDSSGREERGLHAAGVSQPGLPYVLIGHNDKIAWGATLTLADTEDLFVEELRMTREAGKLQEVQYLYKGGWREADIFREEIKVKNHQPILEEVVTTHHGPVISSVIPTDSRVLALSSYALRENLSLDGFARLNEAEKWSDFENAVSLIEAPSLNLVYADTSGNIGYYMSGRAPFRAKGQGLVPAPGWTGEYEWEGYVPFEEMPHSLNPGCGYIVSANNKIMDDDYPHYLGSSWRNGYRAARIEQLILENEIITFDFCRAMQMDLFSIPGAQVSAIVSQFLYEEKSAAKLASHLASWDGYLTADSVGGAIYQVFLNSLSRKTLKPLVGGELMDQFLGAGPHPILVPVNELAGHWTSNLLCMLQDKPEELEKLVGIPVRQLIEEALTAANEILVDLLGEKEEQWTWGRLHYLNFDHLFSLRPALGRSLGHGPYPLGGDSDTIFQNAFAPGDAYHASSVSPSQRHIFDLSDLSQSVGILVPGQSGHPGSKHYGDLIEPWLQGGYFNLAGDSSDGEAGQPYVLLMRPSIAKSSS